MNVGETFVTTLLILAISFLLYSAISCEQTVEEAKVEVRAGCVKQVQAATKVPHEMERLIRICLEGQHIR